MKAHDLIILALALINIILAVGAVWLIYHLALLRKEMVDHFDRVVRLVGGA